MAKTQSNPASRLHVILTAAFKQNAEKKMQEVWRELFKLKNSEREKIASIQSKLISLTVDIEYNINGLKHLHNKQIYIKQISEIAKALFDLGHGHQVQQLRKAINDGHLDSLQICSDLLNSNNCNENTIELKDLDDLKTDIESMIKLINEIDIEKEFKKILLSIMLELKYAIDFYDIHGADGFRLYSEKFIANWVFQKDSFSKLKSNKKATSLYNKLIETFDKANKFVTFAKNIKLALPFANEIIDKIT